MIKIYKITKPIRLIELFSGYGSQAMALKELCKEFDIPYQSWRTCEWEVNAIGSYKVLHCEDDQNDYSINLTKEQLVERLYKWGISSDGKVPMKKESINRKSLQWLKTVFNNIIATKNLVDITQATGKGLNIVDSDKFTYILTYSFPCQDLSLAGHQKGMDKGSNTRSGLLWEVERLLDECVFLKNEDGEDHLPKILFMENVTQVCGKRNKHNFDLWCEKLESLGYVNFYKNMNAKNYGIPQNRDRTIMISIRGGNDSSYKFIEEFPLKMRLKDILEDEDEVDDKYLLNQKQIERLHDTSFIQGKYERRVMKADNDGISHTILARDYKDP